MGPNLPSKTIEISSEDSEAPPEAIPPGLGHLKSNKRPKPQPKPGREYIQQKTTEPPADQRLSHPNRRDAEDEDSDLDPNRLVLGVFCPTVFREVILDGRLSDIMMGNPRTRELVEDEKFVQIVSMIRVRGGKVDKMPDNYRLKLVEAFKVAETEIARRKFEGEGEDGESGGKAVCEAFFSDGSPV